MTRLLTIINKPFVLVRNFQTFSECNKNFKLLKVNLSKNMSPIRNKSDVFASDRFGKRFLGKVAVVTASTDGIGFAIAERMAMEGAKVVISSRKEANVNKALQVLHEKGLKDVVGLKCHVSQAPDRAELFETAVKKFGKIDILVSNAAANPAIGSILDCSEEAWDKIFDVNVKASFLLAKEAAPIIKEQSKGSMIFISSYAGLNPFPLLGAYSVSKTALFGLTKALSQDLASSNIRVNCVAPGVVKTKFAKAMYETKTANDILLSNVPLGRLGEPEEIAAVVAFLASDDASYITGETIVPSGGMPSRL